MTRRPILPMSAEESIGTVVAFLGIGILAFGRSGLILIAVGVVTTASAG